MAESTQELLNRYRSTVRAGTQARVVIMLLIVGIVVICMGAMTSAARTFRDEGQVVFWPALMHALEPRTPGLREDAVAMVERVAPVYQAALASELERRAPEMEAAVHREMAGLDAYASLRWEDMRASIGTLAEEQAEILYAGFGDVVTPAQAAQMRDLYGEALYGQLQRLLNNELHAHSAAATSIGEQLSHMLDGAPPAQGPVNHREMLGVMLELGGIQLQQAAAGEMDHE